MGTHTRHRARPTMQGLLVLAPLAVTSAQVIVPPGLGYSGLHYGLPYAYAANVVKPVFKEVEVPVPVIKFEAHKTGCTNSFGNSVPCVAEGEARKKRDADEEVVEVGAEEAAPVAPVVASVFPFGYHGLGYAGLPYAHIAAPVPTVTEVEVPQYKFVPEEKVVPVQPLCQNAWGFGVPCA